MMKKQKWEIKNRWNGKVICSGEFESLKQLVENKKHLLKGANLKDAYLKDAYLKDAYLRDADLEGANLKGADLRGANLKGADLRGANLKDAYLRDAYLEDAYLRGADLRGANLKGADLRGANLKDAYLKDAYLKDADLEGANLGGANLKGAENPERFLPDLYALKLLPKTMKLRFWKYLEKDGMSPFQGFKYEVEKTYSFKEYDKDERTTCSKGGNVATLMWCLCNSHSCHEYVEVEFAVKDIVAIPYATDGKFRVKKLKVLRKINRKEAEKLLKKAMEVK
jgi:hypothetical protein